jgi:long-subunit acyl-CoA synthetase (AMP-forming)
MTGDVGEWDPQGQIKIIDRKKNLVKTLNGEYIALEKLESVYRGTHVVANICVYADTNKSKPVAIIVPAEPALKKVAEENGIKGEHLEDFAHNEKLSDIVLKQLQDVGRRGGLKGIEVIEGVVLADEEWTPENVSFPRVSHPTLYFILTYSPRVTQPLLRRSTAGRSSRSTRRAWSMPTRKQDLSGWADFRAFVLRATWTVLL